MPACTLKESWDTGRSTCRWEEVVGIIDEANLTDWVRQQHKERERKAASRLRKWEEQAGQQQQQQLKRFALWVVCKLNKWRNWSQALIHLDRLSPPRDHQTHTFPSLSGCILCTVCWNAARLCKLRPSITLNRSVRLVAAGLVRLRLRGPTSAVVSAAWLTAVAAVFN